MAHTGFSSLLSPGQCPAICGASETRVFEMPLRMEQSQASEAERPAEAGPVLLGGTALERRELHPCKLTAHLDPFPCWHFLL